MQTTPADTRTQTTSAPTLSAGPSRRSVRVPKTPGNSEKHSATPSADNNSPVKNMESKSISTASIKPKAKGYDLESSKDKGKKKATSSNPKPWRHPDELPFVRHADWSQDLMMEYMRYHSFSVPPRDASSSVQLVPILLWGSLAPTPDPITSDSSVVVWLPRGYRVPLMFIAKFQWDSLRIVLNAPDPKSDWESFKFDILHLARICQHLFQEARAARNRAIITVDSSDSKAIQKAREKGEKDKALLGGFDKNWRCPSFDRLLTRFYNKWFLSTDEWLAKFFNEFDEEEYHEQDVVKHDWIRWALKGHKGFVLTKEEVQNGITAEQYMWGLTTVPDGDDGKRKWVWDNNREPPNNAVSGWSIPGSGPNLASVQVKREVVEYAMGRDVDHATKSKIDSDPELIARFPEITNPPASYTAPSPPRPTRTKAANTPSAKTPTKAPAAPSASAPLPAPSKSSASASVSAPKKAAPPARKSRSPLPPPWTALPKAIPRPKNMPLRFTTMPESSTPAVGVPSMNVDKASAVISERLLADINGSNELRDLKRKREDDVDKDESISSVEPKSKRPVQTAKRGRLTSRANPSQQRNFKSVPAPSPSDDDEDDDDDSDEEEDDRSRDRSYVFQGNQKKRQKTDSANLLTGGISGDEPRASGSSTPSASTRGSERSKDSMAVNSSVQAGKKKATNKKTSSPPKPVATTGAGSGFGIAPTAEKSAAVLAPGTSSPVPAIVAPMSFLAKPTFPLGAASDKSTTQASVPIVPSRETSSMSAPSTSKDLSVKSPSAALKNGVGQKTAPLTKGKTLPETATLKGSSKNRLSKLPSNSPSAVKATSSLTSNVVQTSITKDPSDATASPSATPILAGSSTPSKLATATNPAHLPPPVPKAPFGPPNGTAIPPVSTSTPIAETNARPTGHNSDTEMKDIETHVRMGDNHAADSSSSFDIASSNGSQPADPHDGEVEAGEPTVGGKAPMEDKMDVDRNDRRSSTPASSDSDTAVGRPIQNDQGQTDSVRFLMVQGNRAKSLHTILLLRDLLQFLRVPGWGNLRELVEKINRGSTMLEPSPQYSLLDDEEVLTADHRLDILAHASVAMAKLLFPYRGEELAEKIESLDNRLKRQFDILWRPEDRPPMKDQGPQAALREEKEVQTIAQSESSSKEIQTIDRDSPKPEPTPPRSFASQEIQAFESLDVGEVGVQTDVEVVVVDKQLSLEDNDGHMGPVSPDATKVELPTAHPVAGTSTTREQPKLSTSTLEPATPTAQAMMSIMRNIANLLELDDSGTVAKSLKGKERETSVVDTNTAASNQSSSLVVDAIVAEFKAMKDELRQSQEKTHQEFESLTAIHRTEVEALKNELRSRDNRGRDELEVIQQQHQEELDHLRETIRTMERDKEKTEEVDGENRIPSLELLELRRRISSLEARARTDQTSETMGSSQAASPSVSHFSEHRQTTFHPLGHLFAGEFDDGLSRVASPSSRPFIRENSTPNPGTPISTGNPFSSRHDGMDLDESMPLPIKSQRKMHMMMFPRPSVG